MVMADPLDDGEFWLPPQFLTDDDIIADNKNSTLVTDHPPSTFPYGFRPFATRSNLSSPVESVLGSSETESDEDEYVAGLNRQMARSSLLNIFSSENPKKWVVSGSPQSILCSVGTGSPNSDIQVSSPPATWDLLHAAADVARMRMSKEGFARNNHGRGLLRPPREPSPVSVPVKNANPDIGFYRHSQSSQFQQMGEQSMMMKRRQGVFGGREDEIEQYEQYRNRSREMLQNRGSNQFLSVGNCGHVVFPPCSRPTSLQHSQNHQQNGSAMRAVFLGSHSGSNKRECAGTGVFLPPQQLTGTPSETRKKPACSTVLVPARAMQALNLNMEDIGVRQPHLQPHFSPRFDQDHYASLRLRGNNVQTHHPKRNIRIQPATLNHELIRLPQEWTY